MGVDERERECSRKETEIEKEKCKISEKCVGIKESRRGQRGGSLGLLCFFCFLWLQSNIQCHCVPAAHVRHLPAPSLPQHDHKVSVRIFVGRKIRTLGFCPSTTPP